MSDGVPTPEQLARIQRGVMGRIDRRRAIGRRIAGSAVAVAVVGGGLVLLGPNLSLVGTSGASSGSAASGTSAGDSTAGTAGTAVLCHASSRRDSGTTEVFVDPAALPDAAARACTTVDVQSGSGRLPSAAEQSEAPATTSGSASGLIGDVAVCRTADDVVHVYPLGSATADERCARNGMTALEE